MSRPPRAGQLAALAGDAGFSRVSVTNDDGGQLLTVERLDNDIPAHGHGCAGEVALRDGLELVECFDVEKLWPAPLTN